MPSKAEYSLEQQVLLAAIRLDHAQDEQLLRLIRGSLDWPRLIKLARRHNLLPQLYSRLKELDPSGLYEEQMQQLHELFLAGAYRNQRLAGRLVDVLDLLAENGIQALPLKGPALAVQAYPDLALRNFFDLDILVREADFLAAYALLPRHGYQPLLRLSPRQMNWLVRTDYHLPFNIQGDVVEVHWRMAEPSVIYPLREQQFWDSPQRVCLLDRSIQLLNPEMTFLSLCIHGAKHHWHQLRWVVDLAYLAESQPALDWQALTQLADQNGFRRILALGERLASQVVGGRIQESVELREQASQNSELDPLIQAVMQLLLTNRAGPGMLPSARFYLHTRERMRDQAYFVYDQALLPKQEEWRRLALPALLYPLYYLLRPARLALKFGLASAAWLME